MAWVWGTYLHALCIVFWISVVSHHPESEPDNRETGYANVLGVGDYSWQLEGLGFLGRGPETAGHATNA